MESINIRNKIAYHLALSNKLQIAAKDVLENERLSVMDVATKYGLGYKIMNQKIYIMKRKKEFYDKKRKFNAARKEFIEGKFTCYTVSFKYEIPVSTLYRELKKARSQENNEYDKKVYKRGAGFTYLQEESLLKILKDWARRESSQGRCSCQLCALEQLLTLAYEFAQKNNVNCPVWDINRQASIGWLIDFEMRHTDEITNSFYSFENVLKQIIG